MMAGSKVTWSQQTVASNVSPVVAATADTILSRPITVNLSAVSVRQALDVIAAHAKVKVLYVYDVLDAQTARVTLRVSRMPARTVFDRVLVGTKLHLVFVEGTTFSVVSTPDVNVTRSDSGDVVGIVRDAKTKQGVKGAKISIDGETKGVLTTDDGTFRVPNVVSGTHVLTVRRIGYKHVTRNVVGGESENRLIRIDLEPSTNQLDQVVVTGTVIPTELRAVPNAITIITGEELQARGVTRIYELFHGAVPGLFTSRTGQMGARDPGSVTVVSRGVTNLGGFSNGSGDTQTGVKTYVDGVELADKQYLGMIDPKNIERIEILTGPQASTIYGSNAINGVIQIFTKRGTTAHPQFTVAMKSAWTQNNFSSSLAPNHDLSTGLSGVVGRVSYNAGLSWLYAGSWTPSVRGQTLSGSGGGRVSTGPVTSDVSIRYAQQNNRSNGRDPQVTVERAARGYGDVLIGIGCGIGCGFGLPDRRVSTTTDNSVGVTETYALASWWSHVLTLGVDQIRTGDQKMDQTFAAPSDTSNYLIERTAQRLTAGYNTTVQVSLTELAKLTVTVGADESRSTEGHLSGQFLRSGNFYGNRFGVNRGHASEHGGYLQSLLGVWDAVFLTYGVRAVYNPNLGANQNPNFEPRYGIAMTQAFGGITAKVRASYGTSTRPPSAGDKDPLKSPYSTYLVYWGTDLSRLGNPDLVPESQQGGEGGLELYLGNRASLQVTRYNQTTDHLIVEPVVDSVDLLPQYIGILPGCDIPWRCQIRQTENLNIGSIRNQGWTAVGQLNLGALTAAGTYSWTKSRIIGITPRYRGQFPQYVVGAAFAFLPEHTWATDLTYANAKTSVGFHVQGEGESFGGGDGLLNYRYQRLMNNVPLMPFDVPANYNGEVSSGFPIGNLNVSHQFTPHFEGHVDISNLMNSYRGDYDPNLAQSGRTTSLGLRLRF
jgi:outer membrane receptor protein involved in Fe transport